MNFLKSLLLPLMAVLPSFNAFATSTLRYTCEAQIRQSPSAVWHYQFSGIGNRGTPDNAAVRFSQPATLTVYRANLSDDGIFFETFADSVSLSGGSSSLDVNGDSENKFSLDSSVFGLDIYFDANGSFLTSGRIGVSHRLNSDVTIHTTDRVKCEIEELG
jgi:hypothetical protein